MPLPDVPAGVKQPLDVAGFRVDVGEMRPLGAVGQETCEGQVAGLGQASVGESDDGSLSKPRRSCTCAIWHYSQRLPARSTIASSGGDAFSVVWVLGIAGFPLGYSQLSILQRPSLNECRLLTGNGNRGNR